MSGSSDGSLLGRSVLVTGGSLGLGYATARACIERGARVAICARNSVELADARNSLASIGPHDVVAVTADISKQVDVERLFDEVSVAFGRIDGVVHAAGVLGPIGPILDQDPGAWFAAVEINLFGTFLVARAAARHMTKYGGGRIVLFSGGGAATPFPNYTAYASSKAAIVRLTETIAAELAPYAIAVNALAPGFVVTRLHQQTLAAGADSAGAEYFAKTQSELERGGVPASVGASCAAFLVSDAADGITGKFVAAPYDDFVEWPHHLEELRSTDIFTLRRILPKERGMTWQ